LQLFSHFCNQTEEISLSDLLRGNRVFSEMSLFGKSMEVKIQLGWVESHFYAAKATNLFLSLSLTLSLFHTHTHTHTHMYTNTVQTWSCLDTKTDLLYTLSSHPSFHRSFDFALLKKMAHTKDRHTDIHAHTHTRTHAHTRTSITGYRGSQTQSSWRATLLLKMLCRPQIKRKKAPRAIVYWIRQWKTSI